MKKIALSILLLVAIQTVSMAQTSKSSSFNSGDNLFSVGIGLGSPYYGYGYSSSLPVNPTVSFERGITDAISVGGTLSYASSSYTDDLYKENVLYIGVRGSYHVNQFIDLGEKIDLYGGLTAGYLIVNYSDGYSGVTGGGSAGVGAFVGGKYYFSSGIGVYAEAGYQSLSFLNVGLSFKF